MWAVIWTSPELLLCVLILALVPYSIKWPTWRASVCASVTVSVLTVYWWSATGAPGLWVQWSGGLLMVNSWSIVSKVTIALGALSISVLNRGGEVLSNTSPSRAAEFKAVPSVLLMMVLLGSLLLGSAINWVSVYLAMELQTLALFVLVALSTDTAYGAEGGLKYYVLGAVSTGLFLFGCALLYGTTGETGVQAAHLLSMALGGIAPALPQTFITAALLFKLAAAPFHMWAPDVYEGAPTIVTALLATVPKAAVFAILVQIGPVMHVVWFCAILSMAYGSLGALNQTRIKRLMAYSGIGHAGFMLFGIGIGSFSSMQASTVYLLVYMVMAVCSFAVILALYEPEGARGRPRRPLLAGLNGLSTANPVMAGTVALVFFSIAGIPPLMGFLGKWLVLLAGMAAKYYLVCIIAVTSSVIAAVYYVRVVLVAYAYDGHRAPMGGLGLMDPRPAPGERPSPHQAVIMGLCLYVIMFGLMVPNLMLQIAHDAVIGLY